MYIKTRIKKDIERRAQYAKNSLKRIPDQVLNNVEIIGIETRLGVRSGKRMKSRSSITRIRNRCHFTNRGRGVLSRLGLSRLEFRRRAQRGLLPGFVKRS